MPTSLLYQIPSSHSTKKGWPWTEETTSIYDSNIVWPKISIVTPSFNQGHLIEETLRSIILQNYPNLEFIIIDGGSTDNTVEVLKKYAEWITYWVSEKDKGQSDAINKGIALCTGDIFNWINSDDFLEPGALKAIAETFLEHKADLVCGYIDVFTDEDSTYKKEYTHRIPFIKETEKKVFDGNMNQPGTFWKLNLIKTLRINMQLHYCMDLELFHRYIAANGANKIAYTDKMFVHFRLHGQSKTVSVLDKFHHERELIRLSIMQSAGMPKQITEKIKAHIQPFYYNENWNLSALHTSKLIPVFIKHIIHSYIQHLSYTDKINLLTYYLKNSSTNSKELIYNGRVLLTPLFIKKLFHPKREG